MNDDIEETPVLSFGAVTQAQLGTYSVDGSGGEFSKVPNIGERIMGGSSVTMLQISGRPIILGVGGYTTK